MDYLLREYHLMYDNASDLLLSVDSASGIIVKCNLAFSLKTGFGENEVVGKYFYELIDYNSKDEELALYRLMLTGKSISNHQLYLKKKDHSALCVFANIYRVTDDNGTVGRLHMAFKDYNDIINESELKKTIKSLEKELQQLKSKNNQLEEFAHITSHNLHSHIVNLNSLLSFYMRSNDEGEKSELIGKLKSLSLHLLNTIEELSDTMIIRSNEDIVLKDIQFEDVFQKTLDILSGQIMESQAEISADFCDAEIINYHQPYLESIMLNLISNAIKYRSPERKCEIQVRTYEQNGEKVLEIKDNGLGIDMKRHGEKIFKLHKIFHHNKDARGVGLFLTKSHVEAMGGAISVESEVERGTTFKVVLNKK